MKLQIWIIFQQSPPQLNFLISSLNILDARHASTLHTIWYVFFYLLSLGIGWWHFWTCTTNYFHWSILLDYHIRLLMQGLHLDPPSASSSFFNTLFFSHQTTWSMNFDTTIEGKHTSLLLCIEWNIFSFLHLV